jgi:hypothetical protein
VGWRQTKLDFIHVRRLRQDEELWAETVEQPLERLTEVPQNVPGLEQDTNAHGRFAPTLNCLLHCGSYGCDHPRQFFHLVRQ